MDNGEMVRRLLSPRREANNLCAGYEADCFHQSGDDTLLSVSYDDTIKVWAEDGGDWYCAATLTAHASTVWTVAVAPSGARFITGSDDGSLAIFKSYTAKEKKALFPEERGR